MGQLLPLARSNRILINLVGITRGRYDYAFFVRRKSPIRTCAQQDRWRAIQLPDVLAEVLSSRHAGLMKQKRISVARNVGRICPVEPRKIAVLRLAGNRNS